MRKMADKPIQHPLSHLGAARKASLSEDFHERLSAFENLAGQKLDIVRAAASIGADEELNEEQRVARAADAMIKAHGESWDDVLAAARRMEIESNRPDFATAVREEIERRHHEAVKAL